MSEVRIEHPNRDKAESKATKAIVALLLIVSAVLIAIVTIGGWAELQGAQTVAFAYVLVYLLLAFYVSRWNRGVLPVAAAARRPLRRHRRRRGARVVRSRQGRLRRSRTLEPSILGLLTVILVPVQLLLLAFAMRGFSQKWNVEVEVRSDSPTAATSRRRTEPAARRRR